MFSSRRIGTQPRPLSKECPSLLLCFCAASLLLTACSRPNHSFGSVTIEHQISPEPPRVGLVVLNLRLSDSSAKAITGAQVALVGDMSHAGMAPVFGEANEIKPGQYQGRLNLAMAGDWVILLHITTAGGQRLERQIDVNSVRPN